MEIIKMQCRTKEGDMIAYHVDIKNVEEAIEVKKRWQVMYGKAAYMIIITFHNQINKQNEN